MSGPDGDAGANAGGDYDRLAARLDAAIDEADRKIKSGRVYDPTNEKVRIQWLRVQARLVDVRRKLERDKDLDDLAERLDALEARQDEGHTAAPLPAGLADPGDD